MATIPTRLACRAGMAACHCQSSRELRGGIEVHVPMRAASSACIASELWQFLVAHYLRGAFGRLVHSNSC